MDVILQGLVGLLLAALEVLGIPRMDIRPLEIPNEDPLEIGPVADVVRREEFEPCSNMPPTQMGRYLMMKWSSSTPSAQQASWKSSSHIPGFVFLVESSTLVLVN